MQPLVVNDYDKFQDIINSGEVVFWQDWDSGGPGAGAGRVTVYRYKEKYYVLDTEMFGPVDTKSEAISNNDVDEVNSSTVAIWDSERGYIYNR